MGSLGRVGGTRVWWRRRIGALGREEAGVSLVELVVACAIFVALIGGVTSTVWSSLDLARQNRNRSVAAGLASQEMDTVRAADFLSLPVGLVSSTETVDGVPYAVARESEWIAEGASAGPCDAQSGTPALLRVHVSVTWPNMNGIVPVVSDTVLAPPVGAFDPNSGHLAVKVLDRNALPGSGVPVTITASGFSPVTITTTSDGCAFFAFLPAKAYTVTLSKVGFVNRQSVSSPAQVVSVNVGAISSVQFDYDQSSTLQLTLTPVVPAPVPDSVTVSLANTQYLPNGLKSFPGSGPARTISDLFPSSSGYQAFTGDCADADPEGVQPDSAGPFWPDATRDPAFQSDPGGTTTGSVRLGAVGATVTQFGVPDVGRTVYAVHAPDTGCPAGETLTVGTTDATGYVLGALPYGTWEIRVAGRSPVGGWPDAVIDPTATAEVPTAVQVF